MKKLLVSVLCVGAATVALAEHIHWDPAVLSGFYNDPNSWKENVAPTDADNVWFNNDAFSQPGEYLVKIPADGLTEGSSTRLQNVPLGTQVTIDATGTTWTKRRTHGTSWTDGILRAEEHIFNIEGLNAANEHDHMGFTLTDGKIVYKYGPAGEGTQFIFESGSFDMSEKDPDGDPSKKQEHAAVLGYATAEQFRNSKVVFAGGSHNFHNVSLRGQTPGFEWLVTGGDHHATGDFSINRDKNDGCNEPAVLHVAGGKLTADGSTMWIGRNKNGSALLKIDGTGTFVNNASTVYFPDGKDWLGAIEVGGEGRYESSTANLLMSHNGGIATVTVKDKGVMDMTSYFNMGEGNKQGSTTLTVKDEGVANLSNMGMNGNEGNTMTINLEGKGTLNGKINMDLKKDTVFNFNMTNDAHFVTVDGSRNQAFGNNNRGVVKMNLMGGTIDAGDAGEFNELNFKGGPGSCAIFGGTHYVGANLVVEGPNDKNDPDVQAYTNTIRQTAGVVDIRMNGNGNGLDIRGGDGCNAMYLLEGGTLNVGKSSQGMIRVGHNRTSPDGSRAWHSVFRQTGGVANIGANVNMCDSKTTGEVELFGGRFRVWGLRGWTYSATRGGNYWASVYANGGTIEPWQDNLTFLNTMDEVTVGEKGLTVDTLTYNNVAMRVKLENAEGQDGLFVKVGTGKLKVELKETDGGAKGDYLNRSLAGEQTYTRVEQGTLFFANATSNVVEFGKNVTVLGGATLSLEGDPAELKVDTLTLGDGHNFAVLKLDKGDKVTVSGDDGIHATCGAIDVPWAGTNGKYPVFVCKGTVDESELANITVLAASADKDYAWTTSVDEETGATTCSMVVADAGTASSRITYGEDTVTTNGVGPVAGITANVDATVADDIVLSRKAVVAVDAGKSLVLSGSLVGTGTEVEKTGSGRLTVSGDNADFFGSFMSAGGTLEVPNAAAFGPLSDLWFPLTLGGGTLLYTGEEEAVFNGALRIDAGEHMKTAILRNEGDMTFRSTEYVQGLFTKLGAGTLTLDLPAGTFAIGSGDGSENVGENSGTLVFPESGDAPAGKDGLYGVNVFEGTLRVKGRGRTVTKLETRNTALLGGQYKAAAKPILEVEDAEISWGAGSRHGCVGRDIPSATASPEVRLTNARFWSDSPTFGRSASVADATATLVMTNSEYWGHYNAQIGGGQVAVVIDANNSTVQSDGVLGWSVQAKRLDADFYGAGAILGSFDPTGKDNNNSGRFQFYDRVTGTLKFRDGARLKTTRGVRMEKSRIDVTFDGGIFEIVPHNSVTNFVSTWAENGKGFQTTGNGLELAIAAGMTHEFDFPIFGEGGVTKTGAGTFKLVSPRADGEKLLQNTGLTTVAEGTLVLDGTLVAEGAKLAVAAGATLDLNGSTFAAPVSGAGTITNGKLADGATVVYGEAVPTFGEGVLGSKLTVDFTGTTAEFKTPYVVGHYTGAAPAGLRVKAVNTGLETVRAVTTCENGDITVTLVKSGFSVLVY